MTITFVDAERVRDEVATMSDCVESSTSWPIKDGLAVVGRVEVSRQPYMDGSGYGIGVVVWVLPNGLRCGDLQPHGVSQQGWQATVERLYAESRHQTKRRSAKLSPDPESAKLSPDPESAKLSPDPESAKFDAEPPCESCAANFESAKLSPDLESAKLEAELESAKLRQDCRRHALLITLDDGGEIDGGEIAADSVAAKLDKAVADLIPEHDTLGAIIADVEEYRRCCEDREEEAEATEWYEIEVRLRAWGERLVATVGSSIL